MRLMGCLMVAACLVPLLLSQPAQAADKPVVLFAFGDSLTAGYGLSQPQSFTVRLQQALEARGRNVTIINGGVSGDTSAQGLARLDWSLPPDAAAAIVEFGANDAFRGVPPDVMKANLDQIVAKLTGHGLAVMVAGMKAPRNLGPEYAEPFDRAFAEVAARHQAVLYPFFLDGVIMDPQLNQPDSIHPNAKGVDVIVARILPAVETLLDRIGPDGKRLPAP